jgi:hypothetical protein
VRIEVDHSSQWLARVEGAAGDLRHGFVVVRHHGRDRVPALDDNEIRQGTRSLTDQHKLTLTLVLAPGAYRTEPARNAPETVAHAP